MSNPLDDVKHFKKTDVSAERVARVYAEALLQSAGNEADSVGDELVELIQVACKQEPNLYPFLASGTIATRTKAEFFEKHFRGKASDVFRQLPAEWSTATAGSRSSMRLRPATERC
jgi:hypothetical protein